MGRVYFCLSLQVMDTLATSKFRECNFYIYARLKFLWAGLCGEWLLRKAMLC